MADNDGIKKRRSVLPFLGQQRSPVHMPPPSSTADALYPRLDALQGCSQELKLFDVGTNGADTSSTNAQTDKWIKRFQYLVETHVLATSKRVKVAVLDTGIHGNHPNFDGEDRIKQLETWTDTTARVDKSGHGTHSVSTILWLTEIVDVYVAKISDVDALSTSDHIAEAIRVVSEEWDVDIISMPFGFPRGSRKVSDEIEKALHRRKILFAAASNDGGNRVRAYPAKQESVICVHSSDGYGNASSFNPTAQDGTDNFCFVGESIQAAWPSSKPDQSGGVKRMSGTSCATAVAVAVAAFMIGFVDDNMPEHTNWVVPLKSPDGIRAIFRAMSERRTGQYDMVNPVRAFGHGSEHEVQKLLTDIRSRLDI